MVERLLPRIVAQLPKGPTDQDLADRIHRLTEARVAEILGEKPWKKNIFLPLPGLISKFGRSAFHALLDMLVP